MPSRVQVASQILYHSNDLRRRWSVIRILHQDFAQQPLQFADDADEGEGGEGAGSTDFASRYAHDALDVPATLDLMTDGIMDTFRVRREALAAASRQRQQDLKAGAEGGEPAAAEPTEPPGDAGGGME